MVLPPPARPQERPAMVRPAMEMRGLLHAAPSLPRTDPMPLADS